ncbi:hypothetical protein BN1723_014084 [Verticillium longisporum]|uniref:Major facilitator superfamily (MFS) profile domain-containing protein n=1 Tax=Verticillium longisporum TaxID=100787 RepID=A0A0G4M2L1_VERLO|nr:hypothetical protein BN1723_014084 [Verticillium longisporum]
METSHQTSRRRLSTSQLSYPNHTLGDIADLSFVRLGRVGRDKDLGPLLHPRQPLSKARQTVLVCCLLLGFLFSTVDTCIVSIPLLAISKEFDDFTSSTWVILAYLLTYMAFATGIAQLSDIYGRRNLLLLSWTIFIAFSMGCGAATSMPGFGGSGLYSIAQISIVEIGPGHRPGLVGAMMGGVLACAFICGPLFGGLITQSASWRWIFNINIPFGLVALGAISCFWPQEPQMAKILTWSAFVSIDFVGGLSLLSASGFLAYGLQRGGSYAAAWDNPEIVTALTIASICWAVFFTWEYLLAKKHFPHIQPLFPIRLATERVYMTGLLVTLLTGFPFVPLTINIPQRFQIIHGDEPLKAGVHLLPMLGACALGSFASGAICSKRNFLCWILMAAASLQLMGLGLMSTLDDPDESVRQSYVYQTIFGLGTGLVFSAATILAAVKTMAYNDLAVANGAMAQARVLGGCIGIAVSTVIFNTHFNTALREQLTPQQMSDLHRSPSSATQWPDEARGAVREVYATAYSEELKVLMYVAVGTLVVSLFTYEKNPTSIHEAVAAAKERNDKHHGPETDLSDLGSLRSTRIAEA